MKLDAFKNDELRRKLFTQEEQDRIRSIKDKINLELVQNLHAYYLLRSAEYVVAGGVFTSLLHDESPNDVDVFILNTSNEVMKMFEAAHKSFGRRGPEEYQNHTLRSHIKGVFNSKLNKFQYILTYYKTHKEVIENFDFVHSKIYYHDGGLFLTRQIYDANIQKKLILNKKREEIKQARFNKFLQRGFRFSEAVSI
jgi:hypothetical protein